MTTFDQTAWDASKAWASGAASDDPAAFYNGICAGKKAGDPKTQGAHALPYKYTPGGSPNAAGVRAAASRLNQTEGLTNKAEATAKIEGLMKELQSSEGTGKKSSGPMSTRAYRSAHSQETPAGAARMAAFPAEMRANLVNKDGRQFYEVEGYATVYNRGYEMWDQAGPYMEVADSGMLTRSLAQSPDVAFLLNHKGMTMARTKNGTLTLRNDSTGLHSHALLNAERTDVQDMARAINDGLIDEMSFAFMIEDGQWDDSFTEFRLMQVNINRGDVSAVNYGANPYTSIGAREQDFMRMAREIPVGMAREAITLMSKREDISQWPIEDLTGDEDETRAMPDDPSTDPVDPADGEPCPDPTEDYDGTVPDGIVEDEDEAGKATKPPVSATTQVSELAWSLQDDEDIPAALSAGDETDEQIRSKPMPIDMVSMYENRWTLLSDDSV